MRLKPTYALVSLPLLIGMMGSCSSGGSSSEVPTQGSDLTITNISVVEGAVWKVNRAIQITFDQPINFATVNQNTIQILDASGVSATGAFTQPLSLAGTVQRNIVRFQPNCPREDDFSDSGLKINTSYQLRVLGANDSPSGITVQSDSGGILNVGQVVNFSTPNSVLPETLFLDTVPGPPAVRIRGLAGLSSTETAATYLELGGDTNNRMYFDASGLGTFEIPLNKYSDVDSQIAVLVYLNQPVLASSANITSNRIRFEYFDAVGSAWEPMTTEVTLEENCVETGSVVRVEPLGLIPQGSSVRVVLRQGFVDLTGDPTAQDTTNFAVMQSRTVLDSGGMPGDDSDELLEEFVLGGEADGSIEDIETPLGDPRANWGVEGELQASFAFGGTGGPGGTFDYHVPAGQTISINTTTATITGGPGGAPVASQTVINGVMDVRNLYVPPSSRLLFVGPNPVTILASGTVLIEGQIGVNGGNNDGVGTLNTTFQPEPGAAGNAGGGKGGTASFLTSSSTPRGGTGNGAFNQAGRGGGGGESTYALSGDENRRRAAGGGGGGFGGDVFYDHDDNDTTVERKCQTLIGMDGEQGFAGSAQGTGAVSQSARAVGGFLGPDPFTDNFDNNNFFGTQITSTGLLVTGELDQVWAGSGGGAGGDASNSATFPQVPFQTGGDEKGSGGGGGAGGLTILAIGSITVADGGFITANGGYGGGGENTLFFDRVGGGGGGGSGGHIVLSSASFIDVAGQSLNSGDEYRDDNSGHRARPISAIGGQGGAGHENRGGASETGPTAWRCDAIRLSEVQGIGGAPDVPPLQGASICFSANGMDDWNDPEGPVLATGGDGSPGILQMHVDDPATNLRFSGIGVGQTWANADVTKATVPPPLGWNGPGQPTDDFVAFFGRISLAQSDWIPLGLARVAPGAAPDEQVNFFFGGTNPATGSVLRSGGGTGTSVDPLPLIIPQSNLQVIGTPPYVEASGLAIVLDGSGLDPAYLVNPRLMRNFSIVMQDSSVTEEFTVVSATVQNSTEVRLTVQATDNLIDQFINTATGTVSAGLRPHYFRVTTSGQEDAFPLGTDVQILFDATTLGPDGLPSSTASFSAGNGGDFTGDVTNLNAQTWDYFRFRVVFNLNTGGGGVDPTAARPGLDYVRVPFVY